MIKDRTRIALLALFIISIPSIAINSMIPQSQQLLLQLKKGYKEFEADVVSPESTKFLNQTRRQIDQLIATLPSEQKNTVINSVQALDSQYKNVYIKGLTNQIKGMLSNPEVQKIVTGVVIPTITTAGIGLIYQGLQIGTGNLHAYNVDQLVTSAMDTLVGQAIIELGMKDWNNTIQNMVSGAGSLALRTTLSQLALDIQQTTFTIPSLTVRGTLAAAATREGFGLLKMIIEQKGGIGKIIEQVKWQKLLIGEMSLTSQEQHISRYAQPEIESILSNKNIQQALMFIGKVAGEAALIGIASHYLGLGFSEETTLFTTMVGAASRGVLEGCMSYLAASKGIKEGIGLKISSGLVSQSVQNALIVGSNIAIKGTDIATVVVQKAVHGAYAYTIDETGGPLNLTKNLLGKVKRAAEQRWVKPLQKTWDDAIERMSSSIYQWLKL